MSKRDKINVPHTTGVQANNNAHALTGKKKSEKHKQAISDGLKDFHATNKKKKWIRKAITHPGALRKAAKRAGLIHGKEKMSDSDIKTLERKGSKTTKKRAQLAETLKKIRERNQRKDTSI